MGPGPNGDFPAGAERTHLLVVGKLTRSVAFCRGAVGAELVGEYGWAAYGTLRAQGAVVHGHLLELSEVGEAT